MAKKYGLNSYTVQESNNLILGQAGFDKVSQGTAESGNWVAIYNPDGSAVEVAVTCGVGDDITVNIVSGTYFYGPFTSIEVNTSSKHVIAYRG